MMIPLTKLEPLTLKSALEIIGGLSEPSKMEGYSWSAPAKNCLTGAKLREAPNTVCSHCYAFRGNYNWPHVRAALQRRFEAINHPRFEEAFIFALNAKYSRIRSTYVFGSKKIQENRFRWFDSGDLPSLAFLHTINRIALGTPGVRHWLPTREFQFTNAFQGDFAPNLVVRTSFPFLGGKATNAKLPQATVGRDADPELWQCPAHAQGNRCRDCSACWSPLSVNYKKH